MRGGENVTRSSTAANSSSIGAISGEWNACDTTSGLHARPLPPGARATAVTAPRSPEMTVCEGSLTAAIDTRAAVRAKRRGRRGRSSANTLAICAVRRERLHQPAARGDQHQRILERQHAGHARRHVLAEAVAHHGRGLDSPRSPQLGERVVDAKSAGCVYAVSSIGDASSIGPGYSTESSGRSRCGRRTLVALVERAAEHRLRVVELPAHARVLRALPGEEERDLGRSVPIECADVDAAIAVPHC